MNKQIAKWKAFFNPEHYQGWSKSKNYFEGWYFKMLNAACDQALAIIPGISMDPEGKQEAFIQVLNGKLHRSEFYRFNGATFKAKPGIFDIQIEENRFSETEIILNLPEIKGRLQFENLVGWPKPWYSPGIMGPYAFVPFMECYHGIVSMDHDIQGQLIYHSRTLDFCNGKGYIEKDWGHSFPSSYVWMQSNHFSKPGISFKASVANIPWVRNSFVGFIAGLWYENQLIRFTTYNNTRLRKCNITLDHVEIILENKTFLLELVAYRSQATKLASPIQGIMDGRIEESMSSKINVQLYSKKEKRIVFNDIGYHAAMEVAGTIEELLIN